MAQLVSGILIGVIGSLLAAFIIAVSARGKGFIYLVFSSLRLAMRISQERITDLRLRREHYVGRLPQYLATAKHSIDIVSIPFSLAHEGAVVDLFKTRIAANPDFRVCISLLDPNCAAVHVVASALEIPAQELRAEIMSVLDSLLNARNSLPKQDRACLRVLVHDSLPMGSAILLDAHQDRGRIQVETKLFRAPRTESFGYEVKAPSLFYGQNYRAWRRVLDSSQDYVKSRRLPIEPDAIPNDPLIRQNSPSRRTQRRRNK